MDWGQLCKICSAPGNAPIVGLIPLLTFYCYLVWKQPKANDDLMAEPETFPAMAKTHHRKIWLAKALLRSYFWHCIGIPLVAFVLMIVHFWRSRKDGISGPEPVVFTSEGNRAVAEGTPEGVA